MKGLVYWGTLALILAVVNVQIGAKEILKRDGSRVLLDLRPRDPRSIMQGDYMELRYALADRIASGTYTREPVDGQVVVRRDARDVAEFVRLDGGEALAPGELRLRYRRRHYAVKLGAEQYFFQEGEGARYARARYGELRVAASGDAVLVGLCDDAGQRM